MSEKLAMYELLVILGPCQGSSAAQQKQEEMA
jgi:hypothetical protein